MIGFNILELHKTYAGLTDSVKFIFSHKFRRNKRNDWQSSAGRKLNDLLGYALSYVLIILFFILFYGLLLREKPNNDDLIQKAIQEEESRLQPGL